MTIARLHGSITLSVSTINTHTSNTHLCWWQFYKLKRCTEPILPIRRIRKLRGAPETPGGPLALKDDLKYMTLNYFLGGFKQAYLSSILILQMPFKVKAHLKVNMSLTCTVRGNTWSSSEGGLPLFWSLFHSLWLGTAETDRHLSQQSLVISTVEQMKLSDCEIFEISFEKKLCNIWNSNSRENSRSPP